jgi:hypothetical protein
LRSVRIFKNNSKSNGYEILSDYQRSLLKLPTRGRPDGWTIDEILALGEIYRLEAMFMPLIMAVEASESGFREKCEKPPFPLSGLSLEPRKKNYANQPSPSLASCPVMRSSTWSTKARSAPIASGRRTVYYVKAQPRAAVPAINEAMETIG